MKKTYKMALPGYKFISRIEQEWLDRKLHSAGAIVKDSKRYKAELQFMTDITYFLTTVMFLLAFLIGVL
jgi:hypothetical protein